MITKPKFEKFLYESKYPWWRQFRVTTHCASQTLFGGNLPVVPHTGTAMRIFDIFCVGSLNKLSNKQSSCRWYTTDPEVSWPTVLIGPMSLQASIPHRPGKVMCMLQWSLSGHQHVCISYPQEGHQRATEVNIEQVQIEKKGQKWKSRGDILSNESFFFVKINCMKCFL